MILKTNDLIMNIMKSDVLIIGGGLAGLTAAVLLQKNGYQVRLIEKKRYPFHRVCGEYISNEVLPFLKSLDIGIDTLETSHINRLAVTAVSGKILNANLALGGFGISRYTLDNLLFKQAEKEESRAHWPFSRSVGGCSCCGLPAFLFVTVGPLRTHSSGSCR